MKRIDKSHKLENVCYDIRGKAVKEAKRLEEEGYEIAHLNIGNPASFGFNAPEEVLHDITINIKNAQGYCDEKGIFPGRKAVMQYAQQRNIPGVDIEDIFLGNGVSELIVFAMQALCNNGTEILLPSPVYPLWSAAVNLAGGKPVYYRCDEESDWNPDMKDLESKITAKTRGVVVINPNNPTGAVYPREILDKVIKLARAHELVVFADEIYDKIVYDGNEHVSVASLADDVLFVTFNGLSKCYRAAGFRAGWMILSGAKSHASDYIEGLRMLASMRLCSNVPAQYGIQTSLGGYQSIRDLVLPGGRLRAQRDIAYDLLTDIPGISCVKPKGALYLFPKMDTKKFTIKDDAQVILDLLLKKHILLVQGTGFDWPDPDHFRVVYLPPVEELKDAMHKIGDFFGNYRQL